MKINDYIFRLIACGYSYDRAYRVAHEIKSEYSMKDLNDYVVAVEKKCGLNLTTIRKASV